VNIGTMYEGGVAGNMEVVKAGGGGKPKEDFKYLDVHTYHQAGRVDSGMETDGNPNS
jgi:hypothetical protein